jgi:hypothetical protein
MDNQKNGRTGCNFTDTNQVPSKYKLCLLLKLQLLQFYNILRRINLCNFEALCYKLEGRRFMCRCGGFLNVPNPASRTMAVGPTQPLTEMSTKNLPGGKKRPAPRADNLAPIYKPNV